MSQGFFPHHDISSHAGTGRLHLSGSYRHLLHFHLLSLPAAYRGHVIVVTCVHFSPAALPGEARCPVSS